MTPVASWSPADYHHARLACHTAWVKTQPQYVIPGLLDELDRSEVARAAECPAVASDLSSPPNPAAFSPSRGRRARA